MGGRCCWEPCLSRMFKRSTHIPVGDCAELLFLEAPVSARQASEVVQSGAGTLFEALTVGAEGGGDQE